MARSEFQRLIGRFHELRQQSLLYTLQRGLDKLWVYSFAPIARQQFAHRTFTFRGQKLPYFIHSYNATWRNERAIEVPLAGEFLKEWSGKRLLEVGNVLSYYFDGLTHDVVDKYENSPGIKNIDIMDFTPVKKYDAVMAVSTLEHVGWDEVPKEPEKIGRALQKLTQLVENPDNIFVTLPLGYNDAFDDLLRQKKVSFKQTHVFKKQNRQNDWSEVSLPEGLACRFDSVYPGANSLFVGIGLEKC